EYQAPVGREWRYNTPAYTPVIAALEKITGKDVQTLTRDWLAGPIGMADSALVTRSFSTSPGSVPWGSNPHAFVTTARALARFGLLTLAGGVWNGQDLLSNPGYLKRMLSPSQDLNPSYGLFWWLNGQPRVQMPYDARPRAGSLIPAAPSDLIETIGTGDRKCYIVPSLRMVVTRLGDQIADQAASPEFENEFWALIMKAAPR